MLVWQEPGFAGALPLVLSVVFTVRIRRNPLQGDLPVGAKMFHRCSFSRAYGTQETRLLLTMLGEVSQVGI